MGRRATPASGILENPPRVIGIAFANISSVGGGKRPGDTRRGTGLPVSSNAYWVAARAGLGRGFLSHQHITEILGLLGLRHSTWVISWCIRYHPASSTYSPASVSY